MGIVARQTLVNTILTYLGFGLGALNTMFLYTRFMSEQYYGLVGVILSSGALLMPLMAVGVPNTLVRYFSKFEGRKDLQAFLSLMLALPLLAVIPLGILSYTANAAIEHFLTRENAIVSGYVWHIFLIGLGMAYFEVFFSWSKMRLRSTFGTFMKEVFVRLGVLVLLVLLAIDQLSVPIFINLLVGLYLLRTALMCIYALKLQPIHFTKPKLPGRREIVVYSLLILLGGSVSVLLLELDRFMINQYIPIENVAYYTVAIFMATVIIVPYRSMHQITYPMTAGLLYRQDMEGLAALYRRSSLSLFILALGIYLLILLNLDAIYQLLPEAYAQGFDIVVLIGAVKVFDSFLGINSSILYNSRYYVSLLMMGVGLALAMILLNMWLIPEYGMLGAAVATFTAVGVYNMVKLIFVYRKFRIHPWSPSIFKVLLLGLLSGFLFAPLSFDFHPLGSIAIKSILFILFYAGLAYRLRLSEDLNQLVDRWMQKKDPGAS